MLSFAAGVTRKPTQVLPPLPELCLSKKPLSDIIGMCHAELLHSDFFLWVAKFHYFVDFLEQLAKNCVLKVLVKCVFSTNFFFWVLLCNQIIETSKQTKNIAYYDAQVALTYYTFSFCNLQQAKV